jgi:hypothetical protein
MTDNHTHEISLAQAARDKAVVLRGLQGLKKRPIAMALTVVAFWGLFAALYLGVEDGSSGLSLIGLLHVFFFLPGLVVMDLIKGNHSNADLPWMWLIGAAAYSLVLLLVIQVLRWLK